MSKITEICFNEWNELVIQTIIKFDIFRLGVFIFDIVNICLSLYPGDEEIIDKAPDSFRKYSTQLL